VSSSTVEHLLPQNALRHLNSAWLVPMRSADQSLIHDLLFLPISTTESRVS